MRKHLTFAAIIIGCGMTAPLIRKELEEHSNKVILVDLKEKQEQQKLPVLPPMVITPPYAIPHSDEPLTGQERRRQKRKQNRMKNG